MSKPMNRERTLWAIDLDQTMLDSDLIFDRFEQICQQENVTGATALQSARKKVEASGGSFDAFGFLSRKGAGDDELHRVSDILGRNEEDTDYLYRDTREFLQALDELEQPYLTVTYGSLRTQLPKLRATRLDQKPYLITRTKKKGELIRTWNNGNAYNVLSDNGESIWGRTVQLVDDKATSFYGIPEDSAGYLVQRQAPKPSQKGATPPRIIKVPDLFAITRVLREDA